MTSDSTGERVIGRVSGESYEDGLPARLQRNRFFFFFFIRCGNNFSAIFEVGPVEA